MAIRFDANGDYISRAVGSFPWNAAYTVTFWYKPNTLQSAVKYLWNVAASSTVGDAMQITSGNRFARWVNNSASAFGPNPMVAGTWYRLAVRRTGATSFACMVDGTWSAASTTNVGSRSGSPGIQLGRLTATTEWPNGVVANLRMWDASLSDDEVNAEFYLARPMRMTSLRLWVPMFPGSGARVADLSGAGLNWTENGTLTDEDGPPGAWGAGRVMAVPFVSAPAGNNIALTAAIAGASVTVDAALAVQRAVLGNLAGVSTTPDVALAVARALSANVAGASTTPNAILSLGFALTAAIAGASTTPAAALAVARLMATAMAGASVTPDATLTVARAMQAAVSGASVMPDAAVTVARALTAAMSGASSTPDVALAVLLMLAANMTGGSSTPDASLRIARAFTAGLTATSATTDTVLAVARALEAAIAGEVVMADAQVVVARLLGAVVAGESMTPDVDLFAGVLATGTMRWSAASMGTSMQGAGKGARMSAAGMGARMQSAGMRPVMNAVGRGASLVATGSNGGD